MGAGVKFEGNSLRKNVSLNDMAENFLSRYGWLAAKEL